MVFRKLPNLARRMSFGFANQRRQAGMIAGVCSTWFKTIGIPYKIDVLAIHSPDRKVFLVWVQMPHSTSFQSQEVRFLRLFLTDRVHERFGLPARSIRLVLHQNIEAIGPSTEASHDIEWMISRFRAHIPGANRSPADLTFHRRIGDGVASAAPKRPENCEGAATRPLPELVSLSDDVGGLHVAEGSMTDFARMC